MPVKHPSRLADLSQTDFRTTLRGFDRDQVRSVLARVAEDYRALEMQNASLRRQLASLEGALRAFQQRTEGAAAETAVPVVTTPPPVDRPAPPVDRPAVRERHVRGIRIISRTFANTLESIDSAMVAVPALRD